MKPESKKAHWRDSKAMNKSQIPLIKPSFSDDTAAADFLQVSEPMFGKVEFNMDIVN